MVTSWGRWTTTGVWGGEVPRPLNDVGVGDRPLSGEGVGRRNPLAGGGVRPRLPTTRWDGRPLMLKTL